MSIRGEVVMKRGERRFGDQTIQLASDNELELMC